MRQAWLPFLLCAALAPALRAETHKLEATRDTWLSSDKSEVDMNMGGAKHLKLKGYQEYALLDFDASKLKGLKLRSAKLCVAPESGVKYGGERGTDLRWFTVTTVSGAWEEGSGGDYAANTPGATFNEADFGKRAWAHPGSKNWDVILGNGETLRCDADAGHPQDGWLAIPLDVRLVQALAIGASHGLLLMEGSAFISTNSFIYSREGGKAPYLLVDADPPGPPAPPAPPGDVKAEPAPHEALHDSGALEVSLSVPPGAFAYRIKVDGQELPRWQVPFAGKAGERQRFYLAYLKPDAEVDLELVTLTASGANAEAVTLKARTSPAIQTPKLPESEFKPAGGDAPKLGEKVDVFAYPEISKLDPLSGKLILEKGMDEAARKNAVWDAGQRTVRIVAARGEIAAFQLALHGHAAGLKVSVEGLEGVTANLWRTWFVKAGEHWQAEYAIPLKAGEAFAVPAADNGIEGQQAGSVSVDLIVPKDAPAGVREGALKVSGEGLGELALKLVLDIRAPVIPDELNFMPELNCYSGPLGDAGSEAFYAAHKLAHYHRNTINRVTHNHNGRTHADFSAKVDEAGRVTDWSVFDKNIGPLLDGSLFKGNPRDGVPISAIYLPFNESYPLPIGPNYRPGEKAELAGEGWHWKHNIWAKPPEEAFPQEYKDAFARCVAEYVKHAEEKGWTKTLLECYNNNKLQYGKVDVEQDGKKVKVPGMTGTAWTLDEPQTLLDWQALKFYSTLFHNGLKDVKTTRFVYRGDISRPMWQGSYMDGRMEIMVSAGNQFGMLPLMRASKRRMPTKLWAYGGCNANDLANHQSTLWCLKAYVHECDGVLPWQSIGPDACFDKGDAGTSGNGLIVDGSKRFGVPAIASYRVHAMRQGAQLCELLRLLELKRGWGRAHSRALLSQRLDLASDFKQAYMDDAAAVTFGAVSGDALVELKEAVLKLLAE
ncbi:MAG: hypothetical protein M5U26_00380 [Planctomycetota bacterium]|nr:hypothetical protein [Planctomycetota bacterium]